MSSITIGSNTSSLRAQRKLSEASFSLTSTLERLSSGARINRASDDAAGLAALESLRVDSRVYAQSIRNINDGVSALNVAEGALEQLTALSLRQRELAAQAANGTYSLMQRRALNAEVNALVDEYNRIVKSTSFNGLHLTDRSLSELNLQAGYGTDGAVSLALGDELARTVGDGSFLPRATYIGGTAPWFINLSDFNGDGELDAATADLSTNSVSIFLGNGNGTFAARNIFSTANTPYALTVADFDGDEALDLVVAQGGNASIGVLLGNGNGTFEARRNYVTGSTPRSVAAADFDSDGRLDLMVAENGTNTASLFLGNGNGTFAARRSFAAGTGPMFVSVNDCNADGWLDVITADYDSKSMSVLLGNGAGTFKAAVSFATGTSPASVAGGDLNNDGILDLIAGNYGGASASVFIGNGDGTFQTRASVASATSVASVKLEDLNGDGILDLVTSNAHVTATAGMHIGNGDGTFGARIGLGTANMPYHAASGDIDGDGGIDLAFVSPNRVNVLLARTTQVTTTPRLNINTRAEALAAMVTIDATLERISKELGTLGASQARLATSLAVLHTGRENVESAAARIHDVDIAGESARMVQTQILQQAASAVMAQANGQPALALVLLKGN